MYKRKLQKKVNLFFFNYITIFSILIQVKLIIFLPCAIFTHIHTVALGFVCLFFVPSDSFLKTDLKRKMMMKCLRREHPFNYTKVRDSRKKRTPPQKVNILLNINFGKFSWHSSQNIYENKNWWFAVLFGCLGFFVLLFGGAVGFMVNQFFLGGGLRVGGSFIVN